MNHAGIRKKPGAYSDGSLPPFNCLPSARTDHVCTTRACLRSERENVDRSAVLA